METKIQVRFPEDVLQDMRELANQHERSFNGEVVWALRQYISIAASPDGRYKERKEDGNKNSRD